MRVVHERCCGLDVHQRSVTACLLTPNGRELRAFGTTTAELRGLVGWLLEAGCTHVAMESTGIYWEPIFNVIEDTQIVPMLVNARHMKALPGRKTDVKDAEWIADLLKHGLLRGSFVPERDWRELRQVVHERRNLIQERARVANRVMKLLETGNVKLKSVISDVLGVSGRAMLEAIARGETDPQAIAGEAKTHLKASTDEIERAVDGLTRPHHQFMLTMQLRHLDQLGQMIDAFDAEIEERMHPFLGAIAGLDGIPGVGVRSAQEIVAEIGVDMSRFPTANHLCSWAKMCPGLKESAGKRGRTGIGQGNRYLRSTLAEAAWAASHTKKSYLRSQFWRIKARRGDKRAVVAVGHSILRISYYLLRDGGTYQDLGPNYFDERDREQATKSAVRRLQRLGYQVTIEPAA
jgi:transposase